MPLTTLDPKTALVVIDLQKGIVSRPTAPHPAAQVVENSAKLAEAFRKRGLPVILVNVAGGAPGRNEQAMRGTPAPDWADLVPELKQRPQDHAVTKRTWGAFMHTDLDAHLKNLGVTQIVLCGISTSIGVESTARQAYELGYNVTLAVDSMADMVAEAHHNSVTRIFPRLGETGSAHEVLELLARA